MNYPMTLKFKKVALAPQISVLDSSGNLIFYVKQKLFKLKEAVTVFGDREQTQPLYKIEADRVIDFSASYHFTDAQTGEGLGYVKRKGRRSIWKAHYEIYNESNELVMTLQEENGWIKVLDAVFGEIPIVGMFGGYVFNPVYNVTNPQGEVLMKLKKNPSFLESSFDIEEVVDIPEKDEVRTVLGMLMMTLLERARG